MSQFQKALVHDFSAKCYTTSMSKLINSPICRLILSLIIGLILTLTVQMIPFISPIIDYTNSSQTDLIFKDTTDEIRLFSVGQPEACPLDPTESRCYDLYGKLPTIPKARGFPISSARTWDSDWSILVVGTIVNVIIYASVCFISLPYIIKLANKYNATKGPKAYKRILISFWIGIALATLSLLIASESSSSPGLQFHDYYISLQTSHESETTSTTASSEEVATCPDNISMTQSVVYGYPFTSLVHYDQSAGGCTEAATGWDLLLFRTLANIVIYSVISWFVLLFISKRKITVQENGDDLRDLQS